MIKENRTNGTVSSKSQEKIIFEKHMIVKYILAT